MADVNYHTRKIWAVANEYYTVDNINATGTLL
jgi:hypothetical protein